MGQFTVRHLEWAPKREVNMFTRRDLMRSALAGGAALLTAPALVRVTSAFAAAPEMTDLTIFGVSDAQISSQQIIASKKGFFADQGLNVTNKLIPSGPDIGPLIAGGSAPVSFETNITVISVAANDVPAVIVGTLANIAGTQAGVGRKDLRISKARRSVWSAVLECSSRFAIWRASWGWI